MTDGLIGFALTVLAPCSITLALDLIFKREEWAAVWRYHFPERLKP
ncbi:MAG: hypothetical protein JWP25_3598 [Bradyrhizobium sp.]|nr:hypothetical protein [Bradyrhizobium sp.]